MNLPNRITLFRICLIPVFIATYFLQLYWASLAFFLALSATDWLDGFIARKTNQVTTLGKYMDPVADKLLNISALILLSSLEPVFFSICLIITFARDFMVDGFRTVAINKNVIIPANWWGKVKTCVQILAISLYFLGIALNNEMILSIASLILIIAVLLTVISGIIYITTKWKEVISE